MSAWQSVISAKWRRHSVARRHGLKKLRSQFGGSSGAQWRGENRQCGVNSESWRHRRHQLENRRKRSWQWHGGAGENIESDGLSENISAQRSIARRRAARLARDGKIIMAKASALA